MSGKRLREQQLLARPEFASINAARFPSAAPLRGIVRNDCRIVSYAAGEILVREGDYGNSAFLVLEGDVRVVLPPGLPPNLLGRATDKKRGLVSMLADAWGHALVDQGKTVWFEIDLQHSAPPERLATVDRRRPTPDREPAHSRR